MPAVASEGNRSPHPGNGESLPVTIGLDQPAPVAREGETGAPQAPAVAEPTFALAVAPGYEVMGVLGRGGMGVVYKARQIALDRIVALKMILHAEHASPDDRARFQVEAEAVGRLQHPNIVQIFEVGETEGIPYFSLEFCSGGSLDRKLDGTPLPTAEAVRLVETLARAIETAHRAHLVHRDLKPANVLLTAEGEPKITDFGLVKKLDVQGKTQTGVVVGTPSYMAPEQAGGQKDVGPAADTYALGAILYELLTGRPPFKAARPLDTILQVVGDEPVPPRRLQSRVPRDLETICLKCLQKQPARRYASAAALADDLQRFGVGEPIQARPVGRGERGWRWCRRNPLPAVMGISLATVLVVFALASLAVAARFRQSAQEEQQLRTTAEQANRILQSDLYFRNMALAALELRAEHPERAEILLSACPPELRYWEWHLARRLCRPGPPVVLKAKSSVLIETIAFHPDSRRLAVAGSKDNRESWLQIWDTQTGRVLHDLHGHNGFTDEVAFSPDGRLLASTGAEGTVKIWDTESGNLLRTFTGHTDRVVTVAFSPDGRLAASAGRDKRLLVWSPDTAQVVHTLRGHTGMARRVRFSPDGWRLASAGWDGVVILWELQTGRLIKRIQAHDEQALGLAFSPNGRYLASAGGVGSRSEVRLSDARTGDELFTRRGHTDVTEIVVFSPDSRCLASVSGHPTVNKQGEIKLWDTDGGQELLTLRGHSKSPRCVAFSPDGRRLATAGSDGWIILWDASPSE